jgi:hypothetical protein
MKNFYVTIEGDAVRYWVDGTRRSGAATVAPLIPSSNEDLVSELNARLRRPPYWVGVLLVFWLFAVLVYLMMRNAAPSAPVDLSTPAVAGPLLLALLGILLAYLEVRREKSVRTIRIRYKLDEEAKAALASFYGSLTKVASAERIWNVTSTTSTWDYKRNAGASSLLTRSRVTLKTALPPLTRTPFKISALSFGGTKIFFLPDQILALDSGHYRGIPYPDLSASASLTSFIESGSVPQDAQIISHTWQYVRKDGGPDRRFSNNRQIPICRYGELYLVMGEGLDFQLQISSSGKAELCANALNAYSGHARHSVQRKVESSAPPVLDPVIQQRLVDFAPSSRVSRVTDANKATEDQVAELVQYASKAASSVEVEHQRMIADGVIEPLEVQALLRHIEKVWRVLDQVKRKIVLIGDIRYENVIAKLDALILSFSSMKENLENLLTQMDGRSVPVLESDE